MKIWFQRNRQTIIATAFLIPILLVAFVSISHVTVWYGLSNPMTWAMYLSLAVEIAALSALAGMSVGMRKFIYVPFGIVTLIQLVGNIFYSFQYIDVTSVTFKSWVDLVDPIFSMMGLEGVNAHRRLLAILSGGLLPMISLTFLHMLVKATDKKENVTVDESPIPLTPVFVPEPPPPAQISNEQLEAFQKIVDGAKPITKEDVQIETPKPEMFHHVTIPEVPTDIPARYVADPSPTVSPTPTPTPVKESDFTRVGSLLKKVQYDNPTRR
jgi:hypothetical protein